MFYLGKKDVATILDVCWFSKFQYNKLLKATIKKHPEDVTLIHELSLKVSEIKKLEKKLEGWLSER